MQLAEGAAAARQREISRLLRQGGGQLELFPPGRQRGFNGRFGGVDQLAGGGLFLLGQGAELFMSAVKRPCAPTQAPLVCSKAARSGAAWSSASAVCFNGSISSSNGISGAEDTPPRPPNK